ncbi:MAG: 7-cyano-7-deazaguanine synthase [Syntrophorhabdus sp. PtaU1.Bin153]|nr:MAG: 7-cyano-7-deazaguanine synthase [Syntrophorhabdus sp. PtaU1.Bin153]
MRRTKAALSSRLSIGIHVVEPETHARRGWVRCEIGQNVEFSTARLESYCTAKWDPIVYDALLVAAAAEFGDRTQRRPSLSWQRDIQLIIPVHEPDRWRDRRVSDSLHDALNFLTGDRWQIAFCGRSQPLTPPRQGQLNLPAELSAVIPFSDGLDSRCVAGILAREMGDRLIRVRLGSKTCDGKALCYQRQPFTSVPYRVRPGKRRFVESSARTRGFKFALLSGLAAYLAKAGQVIMPESGQEALGPALVTVGQGYEDYRSHPLFTDRMERFLEELLHYKVRFKFPQLWRTKAETLKKFVDECEDGSSWSGTWSCWQQTRQVSVDGKKRQCGICAACLLRRLSVHAAGLIESKQNYVWENLSARTFEAGAAASFAEKKITSALREYAIAGTLHLDQLAGLRTSEANSRMLDLSTFQLSRSLGLMEADVRSRLDRLLLQHEREWKGFVDSLGRTSFLANWASQAQS